MTPWKLDLANETTLAETLAHPLCWSLPREARIETPTDLFDPKHDVTHVAAVFGVMSACRQHEFYITTAHGPGELETYLEDQMGMYKHNGMVEECYRRARQLLHRPIGASALLWHPAQYEWFPHNVFITTEKHAPRSQPGSPSTS